MYIRSNDIHRALTQSSIQRTIMKRLLPFRRHIHTIVQIYNRYLFAWKLYQTRNDNDINRKKI